jgi:hypothetical protein
MQYNIRFRNKRNAYINPFPQGSITFVIIEKTLFLHWVLLNLSFIISDKKKQHNFCWRPSWISNQQTNMNIFDKIGKTHYVSAKPITCHTFHLNGITIIANYSLSYSKTYMWPRYGMLRGSRQNHKVSEKTRPLDAWPIGVWICPGVCKSSSQLWVK